jgi:hypothetical protein
MAGESQIRGVEHSKEVDGAIAEQNEDENEDIFSGTLEKIRDSSTNK